MKHEEVKLNKFLFDDYELLILSNSLADWLEVHEEVEIKDTEVHNVINTFVKTAKRVLE